MNTFNYCPICGSALTGTYEKGKSYPTCPAGHYTYFPSQSVAAAAIIHRDDSVLLERRGVELGYGRWGLPGGMAEQGEAIEECVKREVWEETGLHVQVVRLLGVAGGNRVCTVFYEAELLGGELTKSKESLDLHWFPITQIPYDEMAFPRHKETIQKWLSNRSEG